MGATKRLFEQMFDRHDYHEIHFRMLEQEYLACKTDNMWTCGRCGSFNASYRETCGECDKDKPKK